MSNLRGNHEMIQQENIDLQQENQDLKDRLRKLRFHLRTSLNVVKTNQQQPYRNFEYRKKCKAEISRLTKLLDIIGDVE